MVQLLILSKSYHASSNGGFCFIVFDGSHIVRLTNTMPLPSYLMPGQIIDVPENQATTNVVNVEHVIDMNSSIKVALWNGLGSIVKTKMEQIFGTGNIKLSNNHPYVEDGKTFKSIGVIECSGERISKYSDESGSRICVEVNGENYDMRYMAEGHNVYDTLSQLDEPPQEIDNQYLLVLALADAFGTWVPRRRFVLVVQIFRKE